MKIGEIVRIGDREPAPSWEPKRTDAPAPEPAPQREPARPPEEALARLPVRSVLPLDRHI
jgi:hypothetical protein